ncbi:MAG: aminotransferase class V-fold PLP-dependent enzyme [Clostridia bacterium]|nr:aminotransferase class V-fold PLP-dependent enzyme [Deltaproteobacteria bacterium]
MTTRIYLDQASGAPLGPSVAECMREVARYPGNPSSLHALGRLARLHRDEAATQVRRFVGGTSSLVDGTPADVVFTGSGDEANWLGILGLARHERLTRGANRIVVRDDPSATVSAAIQQLVADGFLIANEVTHDCALVVSAIDHASSGVLCATETQRVPVHLDATRGAGLAAIDLVTSGATTIALASEPIGGPRGVGCVVALKGTTLVPLWNGGGQEGGARSGSQAVMLIAGFGEALRAISVQPAAKFDALDVIWAGLDLTPIGAHEMRLAGVSCVHLEPRRADLLIRVASERGVMLGRTPRGVRAQTALELTCEELREATLALAGCAPELQKTVSDS